MRHDCLKAIGIVIWMMVIGCSQEVPEKAPIGVVTQNGMEATLIATTGPTGRTMIDFDTPQGQGTGMFWMPGDSIGVVVKGAKTVMKTYTRSVQKSNYAGYYWVNEEWSAPKTTTSTDSKDYSQAPFGNNLFIWQRTAPFTGVFREVETIYDPAGSGEEPEDLEAIFNNKGQTKKIITHDWSTGQIVGAYYPYQPGKFYIGGNVPVKIQGTQTWTDAASIAPNDIKAAKLLEPTDLTNTWHAQFTPLCALVKFKVINSNSISYFTSQDRLASIKIKTDSLTCDGFVGQFVIDFTGSTPVLQQSVPNSTTFTLNFPNEPLLTSNPWGYAVLGPVDFTGHEVNITITTSCFVEEYGIIHRKAQLKRTNFGNLEGGKSYECTLDLSVSDQ